MFSIIADIVSIVSCVVSVAYFYFNTYNTQKYEISTN